jgi:hypothetical protein
MPAQDPGLDERYSVFSSETYVKRKIIKLQGGAQNDPVFDLLIKSLFQLQY